MLQLDNGEHCETDLVIAADGIHSLGRNLVSADSRINYSGYVLWRGLLPEAEMSTGCLREGVVWNPYRGGLAGYYFISGEQGGVAPGQRLLNWGAST